jgi:uncharacterized membrane protein
MRGAVVAALPTVLLILKALGVDVANEEAMQIVDAVMAVLGAIGVVMVIVGRVRVEKRLGAASSRRTQ